MAKAQDNSELESLSAPVVEELLSCIICTDVYTDPKVLPCHHTFCEECLEPLTENQKLQCPICRKKCTLTAKGVRDLPNDFRITQVKEAFLSMCKKGKSPGHTAKCDFCKYMDATIQASKMCVNLFKEDVPTLCG